MKKDNEKRLDILSNIDDELIDRHTERRYRLYGRKRSIFYNNTFRGFTAAAVACVLLIFIILPLAFTKQVPVYEGMTVSSTAPDTSKPTAKGDTVYTLASAETSSARKKGEHRTEKELFDSLKVEGAEEDLYYAKQGEDVYVTVHISNPDKFEILSFTLNGEKYSSYMFEDGSDLENLILKCNVGDAEGILEYTIDQIKYIDGTTVKDVRMEGDKTVRIGIYNENQPTAKITDSDEGYTTISFNALVNDPEGLIEKYGEGVWAVLYDGDEIVDKKQLSVGEENAVSFEGLLPNKTYLYSIVAVYDAFDGEGMKAVTLDSESFNNDPTMSFSEVVLSGSHSASFKLNKSELGSVIKVEAINEAGEVVRSVTGGSSIGGLPSEKLYLKLTYSYFDGEEDVVCEALSDTFYPSLHPVKGVLYRSYSKDYLHNFTAANMFAIHLGYDFIPDGEDMNVYSIESGTVSRIYEDSRLGLTVEVERIKYGKKYIYIYSSLSSVNVELGDEVDYNGVLGVVGVNSYEYKDTEPHVHFFVKEKIDESTVESCEVEFIDNLLGITDRDILHVEANYLDGLIEDHLESGVYVLRTSGKFFDKDTVLSYSSSDPNISLDGSTITVLSERTETFEISITFTRGEQSITVEHTLKIKR